MSPPDPEVPAFAEPWQAEAFALVIALHQRGAFTWSEWAHALSREVGRADAAPDGHDYYEHWVSALEALLAAKGLADAASIDATTSAWQRAAHATRHGKPISLENDPLRPLDVLSPGDLPRSASPPTAPAPSPVRRR